MEQAQGISARPLERILRRPEVERATGLARSTLYDLMAASKFPKPVALSGGAVGWIESEVAAWQAARIAARDGAALNQLWKVA